MLAESAFCHVLFSVLVVSMGHEGDRPPFEFTCFHLLSFLLRRVYYAIIVKKYFKPLLLNYATEKFRNSRITFTVKYRRATYPVSSAAHTSV